MEQAWGALRTKLVGSDEDQQSSRRTSEAAGAPSDFGVYGATSAVLRAIQQAAARQACPCPWPSKAESSRRMESLGSIRADISHAGM